MFSEHELGLLLSGLDAIEPSANDLYPISPVLTAVLATSDPELLERVKAEQQRVQREASNQRAVRKEQIVLLKAKLVGLRQALAADLALRESAPAGPRSSGSTE